MRRCRIVSERDATKSSSAARSVAAHKAAAVTGSESQRTRAKTAPDGHARRVTVEEVEAAASAPPSALDHAAGAAIDGTATT